MMAYNRKTFSRRDFINLTSQAGALLAISNFTPRVKKIQNMEKNTRKICIFSKHLQWLDYEKMAQIAAELGFDGIDLTVRPGGHVLPENVGRDLPEAVKAVEKAGIKIHMITTNITDASDTHAQAVLNTAKEYDIQYYRMNWYAYRQDLSITENLSRFHLRLQRLVELNEKIKIKGAYQNHAGMGFGSSIWDLWYILKDIGSDWLGCQYDIRHATVEGYHTWPLGFKLIAPYINTLDIKDFKWHKSDEDRDIENVPLGEGLVDFKYFFELLNEHQINSPVSLHYEYELGGAEDGSNSLSIPEYQVLNAIKRDLTFIKNML